MNKTRYDYAVIGGDMRQVYLAAAFACQKESVCHFALSQEPNMCQCEDMSFAKPADSLAEACRVASCVVGPIPLCRNGSALNQSASVEAVCVNSLLPWLQSGQSFFAGCIPEDFKTEAQKRGVRVFDLMQDEALAAYNSIATAEGAICEAIRRSPINMRRSRCAVLGYGRCGNTITQCLKGMSADVSVFSARDRERILASIAADCSGTFERFKSCAGEFDFIFNTIPAPVVTEEFLVQMKKTVTIIDIASAPGGVDFAAAKKLGRNASLCPGLPGKYAPLSSADAIKETIERIRNNKR